MMMLQESQYWANCVRWMKREQISYIVRMTSKLLWHLKVIAQNWRHSWRIWSKQQNYERSYTNVNNYAFCLISIVVLNLWKRPTSGSQRYLSYTILQILNLLVKLSKAVSCASVSRIVWMIWLKATSCLGTHLGRWYTR